MKRVYSQDFEVSIWKCRSDLSKGCLCCAVFFDLMPEEFIAYTLIEKD